MQNNRLNKLRASKKRVEFYLDESQIEYSKIKMFALMHQVSISKLLTDAVDAHINNVSNGIVYYPEGGYQGARN